MRLITLVVLVSAVGCAHQTQAQESLIFTPLEQQIVDLGLEAWSDAKAASEALPQVKHARKLAAYVDALIVSKCPQEQTCRMNWDLGRVEVK